MNKVPITLITGFLGSGKTTLINHIISKNKDFKIGVILNEFGDVALESNFLKPKDEEVVEIPNGCMCCVAKKDFIGALDKVIQYQPDTEYIIIEASGISDPLQILLTFYSPLVKEKFRLDSILCVVDFLNYDYTMDNYDIASEQIATSDIILLSKTQQGDLENIERVKSAVLGLNSKARILIADEQLELDLIMDTFKFDYKIYQGKEIEHHPEHLHENITDLFYKTKNPFNYNKLINLYKNLDKSIIRSKGFVNFKDAPVVDKKYLIQYVGGRMDLTYDEWDNNELRESALLFVGKEFNRETLLSSLKVCEYS